MTTSELPISNRPTVTVQEASAYTGMSRAYIYRWLKDGKVKRYKIGKRTLIDAPSLLACIGVNDQA